VPLGQIGDIGVTAPRKSLPVLNGGYLYLRSGALRELENNPLQPLRGDRRTLRDQLNRVRKAPLIALWLRFQGPDFTSQDYPVPREPPLAMYRATHEFTESQDLEAHRARRREIYDFWKTWTTDRGLTPVFPELRPGASPLLYPAYAPSARIWARWLRWGRFHDIEVYSWPTLPRELVYPRSPVLEQWRRMVCFPIHAEMKPNELMSRLAGIKRFPRPW
jgi:hypothetical protein